MGRVQIVATDGMILTNGETYGRIVYLGSGDKVENWHEITEEAYKGMMEEMCHEEDLY